MRLKWAFVALLALPVAEIGLFLTLWGRFGFLPPFLASVATSLLGVALLRQTSGRALSRSGPFSSANLSLTRVVAAILLILPGFITDAAGLLLLHPATTQFLQSRLGAFLASARRPPQGAPSTIDLDPGEWHPLPDDRPVREADTRSERIGTGRRPTDGTTRS